MASEKKKARQNKTLGTLLSASRQKTCCVVRHASGTIAKKNDAEFDGFKKALQMAGLVKEAPDCGLLLEPYLGVSFSRSLLKAKERQKAADVFSAKWTICLMKDTRVTFSDEQLKISLSKAHSTATGF